MYHASPSNHTRVSFSESFSLWLKPGEDLDWDEEFALQDFLKRELVERNCKERGGSQEASPKEAADKLVDRAVEVEEDGEEKWMVVEKAGEEEVRDTSTPLSAHPEEAQAEPGEGQGECGDELGGISADTVQNCKQTKSLTFRTVLIPHRMGLQLILLNFKSLLIPQRAHS